MSLATGCIPYNKPCFSISLATGKKGEKKKINFLFELMSAKRKTKTKERSGINKDQIRNPHMLESCCISDLPMKSEMTIVVPQTKILLRAFFFFNKKIWDVGSELLS